MQTITPNTVKKTSPTENRAYILLDRSGSMAEGNLIDEAVTGTNVYVQALSQDFSVVVATFDSYSYDVIRDCLRQDWKNIEPGEVIPRASTPLFDSAAKLIRQALEETPKKAVLVVITDGWENTSQETNKDQILSLVEKFKANQWEVIFIGANFDKIDRQATQMGVQASRSINVGTKNMAPGSFTRAASTLGAKTRLYASGTVYDEKAMDWTVAETAFVAQGADLMAAQQPSLNAQSILFGTAKI